MKLIIVFLICYIIVLADQGKNYNHATVLFTENECNIKGGIKEGCWFNSYLNSDLWANGTTFGLDKNLHMDISIAGMLSKEPSVNYIGDFHTASNIEAPSQLLLYSAFLSYKFEKVYGLELSAGLIDLNSIYDVTESASILINSSFGISAGLSANGAYSINVSIESGKNNVELGVFDANPTKRAQPFLDGYFSILQWEKNKKNNYNIYMGVW